MNNLMYTSIHAVAKSKTKELIIDRQRNGRKKVEYETIRT